MSAQSSADMFSTGIIAREEAAAIAAIRAALEQAGVDPGNRPIELRAMPFEGTLGSASTVARMFAGELVTAELTAQGKLEGLGKKETKALVNQHVQTRAQELAESIAAALAASGQFGRVEAENGFVNIFYDVSRIASSLIAEVLSPDLPYGHAEPGSRKTRVMIEHSQLNTHKAAHVGHLRCICIGVAETNISKAAGFPTMPVTYIGDIGRHVVQCLWCYEKFHRGEEPKGSMPKGQWLGEIYAESSARLGYRKQVIEFLTTLSKEDEEFVEALDRMLKQLWRKQTQGEDIAYLLGRISHQQPIEPEEFREDDVMVKFWPIVGEQLQIELETEPVEQSDEPASRQTSSTKAAVEPTMTPEERYETWQHLAEHMDAWWPGGGSWEDEIRAYFQLWERKDPRFVDLWKTTRQWSLDDLQRVFDEFGATFDHWFFESEVEDAGRLVVRDLLERGIAEISEGLPVVKIDEQLGLEQETYRTMPILRSDGTTLYSTKDLALTQQKFLEFGVDQAIWVVDVRQSLYFDQIFKILEIAGFKQATQALHLGYEFVSLPSGAISSRKGTAPMLEDVRDTMIADALRVMAERNVGSDSLSEDEQKQIAHDVAIGAISYSMLARDFNKVIVFDPDEALSFDGHASPYIQYAHARACRILEHGEYTDEAIRAGLSGIDFSGSTAEELTLLQQIAEFPGIVQRSADEHRPLHMTNYVYELARKFSDFYHACPVLTADEPVRSARVALVAATRTTLKNGLALLGIAAPPQM